MLNLKKKITLEQVIGVINLMKCIALLDTGAFWDLLHNLQVNYGLVQRLEMPVHEKIKVQNLILDGEHIL